jgi:hypothetical protein
MVPMLKNDGCLQTKFFQIEKSGQKISENIKAAAKHLSGKEHLVKGFFLLVIWSDCRKKSGCFAKLNDGHVKVKNQDFKIQLQNFFVRF